MQNRTEAAMDEVASDSVPAADRDNRLRDLIALTKPRITFMVLVSAGAGFVAGSGGRTHVAGLMLSMVGIGLVAGGTSALNQILERDADALMQRTRERPLPAGRVTVRAARSWSVSLAALGVVFLWAFVNSLTALLALIALLSYVMVYTPLKRKSSLSTLVGAVPGALPIMGGWTAASGSIDPGAWALFGILFFWQLPHFLALAWLYRDDYQLGGFRLLGVGDPGGRQTRQQSVLYALALVPTSLLPVLLGMTGPIYAIAALTLTLTYLASALRFARRADTPRARGLFGVSLLYLPLLLLLLTLDGRAFSRTGVGEVAVSAELQPAVDR